MTSNIPMRRPPGYLFPAALTFAAVYVFSFIVGVFLQTLVRIAMDQYARLLQGKPLPVLAAFYQKYMHWDYFPTFLVSMLPCLVLGLYLLWLGHARERDDDRRGQIALGAIVCLAAVGSFAFLTMLACLGPLVPFGGRVRSDDYSVPAISTGIFLVFLVLLAANFLGAGYVALRTLRRRDPE